MEPISGRGAAIRTARLDLRQPGPADVPAILRLLSDPRTTAHNPGDALTDVEEVRQLVERWTRHWSDHGIGYWVLTWRDGSEVLGVSGVKLMTLHGRAVWNLLYRLEPDVWRRGIATESAVAVVERAMARHPDHPVVARVRPANRASARVALKAGLVRAPELDTDGEDGPDQLYTSARWTPV